MSSFNLPVRAFRGEPNHKLVSHLFAGNSDFRAAAAASGLCRVSLAHASALSVSLRLGTGPAGQRRRGFLPRLLVARAHRHEFHDQLVHLGGQRPHHGPPVFSYLPGVCPGPCEPRSHRLGPGGLGDCPGPVLLPHSPGYGADFRVRPETEPGFHSVPAAQLPPLCRLRGRGGDALQIP